MVVVLIKGVFSDVCEVMKEVTLNPVCKEVHGYGRRRSYSMIIAEY